jgi:hypothetical protein
MNWEVKSYKTGDVPTYRYYGNEFATIRPASRYQPKCRPILPGSAINLTIEGEIISAEIRENGWRCPAYDRLLRLMGGPRIPTGKKIYICKDPKRKANELSRPRKYEAEDLCIWL